MAKYWSEIQVGVRHNARDDSIDLTVDPGLARANSIYRKMSIAIPWPELRVTTSTTSIAADAGTVVWPTSPVYTDVVAIECGIDAATTAVNLLISPQTEYDWNMAAKQVNTIPVYYVRRAISGVDSLELRPIPNYDLDDGVKITGYTEPTAYDGTTPSATPTVFLQKTADDALELLIAADWLAQQGSPDFAMYQIQQATQILQRMFSKELVPAEMVAGIVGMKPEQKGGGGTRG